MLKLGEIYVIYKIYVDHWPTTAKGLLLGTLY